MNKIKTSTKTNEKGTTSPQLHVVISLASDIDPQRILAVFCPSQHGESQLSDNFAATGVHGRQALNLHVYRGQY